MKSKEILRILLVAGVLASSLFACTSDVISPKKPVVPDSASFKLNVIPIFNTSCNTSVGCHATGGKSPDLTPPHAYVSLTVGGFVDVDAAAADPAYAETSPLYVKITTGSMKVHATDQDRDIILKWIQQGALDN